MKAHALAQLHVVEMRRSRIWIFFGVVLAVLVCSAALSIQPVQASSSCTSQMCTLAHNFAVNQCRLRGNLTIFVCPSSDPNASDDFDFCCAQGVPLCSRNDCTGLGPS
jgi:hypothetical protein